MEAQQQQSQNEENGKGGGGGAVGSSYHISSGSRQSSTRWTPTTDQIRILKELYYNNGIRSPSAEQIQRISARLRQYGKIEGKNVFYWFQNHKARERQKKRFTSDHTNMQRGSSAAPTNNTHNNNNAANNWKPDQETIHNKYTNIPTGVCASSSAGMVTMGQVGNYGYGSVPMEKSFRDCTISAGGSSGHVGAINHNLGWVGVDPYSSTYTTFFDKIIPNNAEEEEEDDNDNDNDDDDDNDNDDDAPEIETLPLFPMHGEDIHGYCSNLKSNTHNYDGSAGWYHHHHHHHHHQIDDNSYGFKNGSRASLELSLNSYSRKSPDFA